MPIETFHECDLLVSLFSAIFCRLQRPKSFSLMPDHEEISAQVQGLLRRLKPREARLLQLRFGIGCEQRTIAQCVIECGMSRSSIHRIERHVLRRLQQKAEQAKLKSYLQTYR